MSVTVHSVTSPAQGSLTDRPVDGGRVALLVGLALLALAPYLVGALLPYYVNDLDELPVAELTSGRYDPKDLWPQGTIGGLAQLAGFLSLAITPLGLVATLAGCVHALLAGPGGRAATVTAGLFLVALLCLGGLGLVFSPLGNALATWRLD